MGYRQVPVLGINLGRLGFLADLTSTQLENCFAAGRCRRNIASPRTSCSSASVEGRRDVLRTVLGLNEVVDPHRPAVSHVDLELDVDGEPAAALQRRRPDRQHAGRLDRPQPVGGRADSRPGAGRPSSSRRSARTSLTTPAAGRFRRQGVHHSAEAARRGAGWSWMARTLVPLKPDSRVTVRRAPVAFRLVKVAGHSYFRTLHDKLDRARPRTIAANRAGPAGVPTNRPIPDPHSASRSMLAAVTPIPGLLLTGIVLALVQRLVAIPWLYAIDPMGFRASVRKPLTLLAAAGIVAVGGACLALVPRITRATRRASNSGAASTARSCNCNFRFTSPF